MVWAVHRHQVRLRVPGRCDRDGELRAVRRQGEERTRQRHAAAYGGQARRLRRHRHVGTGPEPRGHGAVARYAVRQVRGRQLDRRVRKEAFASQGIQRCENVPLHRYRQVDLLRGRWRRRAVHADVPRARAADDPGRPQMGAVVHAPHLDWRRARVQEGRPAHVHVHPLRAGGRERDDRPACRGQARARLDPAGLPQEHRGRQRARLLEHGAAGRARRQVRLAAERQRALRVRGQARRAPAVLRSEPLLLRELPRPGARPSSRGRRTA